MKIKQLKSRQIFDSRGLPTVEVEVRLEEGGYGRAAVPSGASTGSHEALELRDGGKTYAGKAIGKALQAIETQIVPALHGKLVDDQSVVDTLLCELDGTTNKSNLGANAILAVSLAVAKAVAHGQHQHFYEYIAELSNNQHLSVPRPMVNVLNGGVHAPGASDIQEWMIVPLRAESFVHAMQVVAEVFQSLKVCLKDKNLSTLVGDEGGFAPLLASNEAALVLLKDATEAAGYGWGTDIGIALDAAATEFYRDNKYQLARDKQTLSSNELGAWYQDLIKRYPIVSLEDPFAEDDWSAWTTFMTKSDIQIVGDDLLVTNEQRIAKAIEQKAANAVLIKPNQIGTLTETIRAVTLAQSSGWGVIISHRSGETEDTSIAHIAVGTGAGQIKTGSFSRSERLAKYNELIRISEHPNIPYARIN